MAAGYDNGDLKLFDLRVNKVRQVAPFVYHVPRFMSAYSGASLVCLLLWKWHSILYEWGMLCVITFVVRD